MANQEIKIEPSYPDLEPDRLRDFSIIGNQSSISSEMIETEEIYNFNHLHDNAACTTTTTTLSPESDQKPESIFRDLPSSSTIHEDQSNTCSSCKKEIDELKLLINQQQETQIRMHKALIEEIVKLQRKLDVVLIKSNNNASHLLPRFPLVSEEAFLKMEKALNNDAEMENQMKNYFKRVGGEDVTSFVRSCLRSILPDSVAEKFSWLGTKEKRSVRLLLIIKILKDACYDRFPASTDTSIDRVIKTHFTYAHDRIQKKIRAMKEIKCFSDKPPHTPT